MVEKNNLNTSVISSNCHHLDHLIFFFFFLNFYYFRGQTNREEQGGYQKSTFTVKIKASTSSLLEKSEVRQFSEEMVHNLDQSCSLFDCSKLLKSMLMSSFLVGYKTARICFWDGLISYKTDPKLYHPFTEAAIFYFESVSRKTRTLPNLTAVTERWRLVSVDREQHETLPRSDHASTGKFGGKDSLTAHSNKR